MSAQLSAWVVEAELSGAGGGWTDLTADVLLGEEPLRFHYGIDGNGPMDRVANTGWCTFVLDNSTNNSGGVVGYYSPLHASVRSGFGFGIAVRVRFTFGGITYYKFRGRLREIEPVPGSVRERITRCVAVDWMEEAAEHHVRGVSLQVSQRSDQVFSAVLADITKQPAASSIAAGKDTFTYALENLGGDRVSAASIFQDIAQSELGFIYVKGDTSQGETLVFEHRQSRAANTTNAVSFNNDMTGLVVPRTLDNVFNRVEVVVYTRAVDAAATTVLFTLPQPQTASIAAGSSITMWGDYRDPAEKATWVGGTAMVSPVATTDYTMHTAADGTGTDLTASFSVTATFFASSVKFVITNNHASSAGFITFLRCRGKGVYRYDPATFRSDVTASQTSYGLRPITVPMPYQDSHATAQGAADYLAFIYGTAAQQVDAITFDANRSSTFLTAALAREISDRIGIDETVTGVTATAGGGATRGWYINAVEFEVQPASVGPQITCTWGLSRANEQSFWILDQVGASELDASTILGYV